MALIVGSTPIFPCLAAPRRVGFRKPSKGHLRPQLYVSCLAICLGFCGVRRARRALAASARTELLVDADGFKIEDVQEAIAHLEDAGKLKTTIFAAPGRVINTKWAKLMATPGVRFQAVPRAGIAREPNDDALVSCIRKVSRVQEVDRIALLTADKDFLDVGLQLRQCSTHFLVLVPQHRRSVIACYQEAGIEVVVLKTAYNRGSPVRAILHEDGDGYVELAKWYKTVEDYNSLLTVSEFLQNLGYMKADDYVITAIAKFWFANRLGSLTVFPQPLATLALHVLVTQSTGLRNVWDPDSGRSGSLAYFLPLSAYPNTRRSKAKVKSHGNAHAYSVFQGGGPFMLEDSDDLIGQALSKLGYLDEDLNTDLTEAMLCFINAAENKKRLRKQGFLPCSGDANCDVQDKLRSAFLSSRVSGTWQIMNRSPDSLKPILSLLQEAKLLTKSASNRLEIFEAMKLYAATEKLPAMKTFNGLAWRIRRHRNRDPNRRSTVEIPRWLGQLVDAILVFRPPSGRLDASYCCLLRRKWKHCNLQLRELKAWPVPWSSWGGTVSVFALDLTNLQTNDGRKRQSKESLHRFACHSWRIDCWVVRDVGRGDVRDHSCHQLSYKQNHVVLQKWLDFGANHVETKTGVRSRSISPDMTPIFFPWSLGVLSWSLHRQVYELQRGTSTGHQNAWTLGTVLGFVSDEP